MAPRVFLTSRSSNSTVSRVRSHETHDGSRQDLESNSITTQTETQSLNRQSTAMETTPSNTMIEQSSLSKPVGIPAGRRISQKTARQRAVEVPYVSPSRNSQRILDVHDPTSLPSSVAALLAMTAIPPQKKNSLLRSRINRRRSDRQEEEASPAFFESQEDVLAPLSSPLDLLLGPMDDSDEESRNGRTRKDSVLSLQSDSSDSVPSLAGDDESMASVNSPPTPSMRGRASLLRKARLESEDCKTNHPLARPAASPTLPSANFVNTESLSDSSKVVKSASQARPAFFKSNLTASLRAFKSAALSISNFANSSIPPDDLLTRSILSSSPQFADERRPPELPDAPSPAMRRYFNPLVAQPIHRHASFLHDTGPEDHCTASIQLQVYRKPSHRQSKSRRASSIPRRAARPGAVVPMPLKDKGFFAEASCDGGPIARQRESRENSDFLRVICLEMSMRRSGKLSDTAVGRARIALPPRKPGKEYRFDESGVPVRWIAIQPALSKSRKSKR